MFASNESVKKHTLEYKKYMKMSQLDDVYYSEHISQTAAIACFAAHLFLHCSCLFLIKFTVAPLLF